MKSSLLDMLSKNKEKEEILLLIKNNSVSEIINALTFKTNGYILEGYKKDYEEKSDNNKRLEFYELFEKIDGEDYFDVLFEKIKKEGLLLLLKDNVNFLMSNPKVFLKIVKITNGEVFSIIPENHCSLIVENDEKNNKFNQSKDYLSLLNDFFLVHNSERMSKIVTLLKSDFQLNEKQIKSLQKMVVKNASSIDLDDYIPIVKLYKDEYFTSNIRSDDTGKIIPLGIYFYEAIKKKDEEKSKLFLVDSIFKENIDKDEKQKTIKHLFSINDFDMEKLNEINKLSKNRMNEWITDHMELFNAYIKAVFFETIDKKNRTVKSFKELNNFLGKENIFKEENHDIIKNNMNDYRLKSTNNIFDKFYDSLLKEESKSPFLPENTKKMIVLANLNYFINRMRMSLIKGKPLSDANTSALLIMKYMGLDDIKNVIDDAHHLSSERKKILFEKYFFGVFAEKEVKILRKNISGVLSDAPKKNKRL